MTRYFGGILLGAGGLTRAYTKGASDALTAAGIARMGLWTLWDVPCTYPLLERMKLEVAATGGVVRDAEYGADITRRGCGNVPAPADGAFRREFDHDGGRGGVFAGTPGGSKLTTVP